MEETVKTPRTYSTVVRKEQAAATRERIIAAARRLFAERGYHDVTLGRIANEAGVAVQTVQLVFGTKPGLAEAIVEAVRADFDRDVAEIVARVEPAGDPVAILTTVAAIARHILDRYADVMRFLRESGSVQIVRIGSRLDVARSQSQAPIAPALAAQGRLRPGLDESAAAEIIWALTSADLYDLLVGRKGWSPDQYERHLAALLVGSLLDERTASRFWASFRHP